MAFAPHRPAPTGEEMADGVKQKKASISQTEWTLYFLAVSAAILATLAAVVAHLI